jgi:putative transposase
MARPLRIIYDGAVYHVTLRGNERKAIFRDDQDRERYLFKLEESLQRYDVRLYLFCLMTNHVHMVLETPRGNLSRFMQRFQTAYALYFNRRHKRSGHLWQGRFGASVVDEDEYILKLSRYVHLNPVYTKKSKVLPIRERIDTLRSYPWSSYCGYIGKAKPMTFVDEGPVLAMMGRSVRKQRATYRRFVEAAIIDIDAAFIEAKRQSPLCIGSEPCLERIRSLYETLMEDTSSPQDISFRRPGRYCRVEDVLSAVCEVFGVERSVLFHQWRGSMIRPMAAQVLCEYSGLTQREVAEILKLQTGAAVSHQIKRLGELMGKTGPLSEKHARIVRIIQQKQP